MECFNEKDMITMKLLHYFITEENYSPVVLHGAKDEIWLENLENNYAQTLINIQNYYLRQQALQQGKGVEKL